VISKDGDRPPGEPRFYGRRKGHELKPGRQRLYEEALPLLRLPDAIPADLRALFAEPVDDVWLEIGFGSGEHLAHQARTHGEIGFIGCEPFVNGVAALLAVIAADGTSNIRIFDEDARLLLPRLPDASIGRVFLMFPDPWPKTRHHKRRFIQPDTLDGLARVMRPGGELRFASDDPGYVRWTLAHALGHPAFGWTAQGPADWRTRWPDAIATRYEAKGLAGESPSYLTFRRR
jgi:tRNA (guanine-N7-)-methyltransferase